MPPTTRTPRTVTASDGALRIDGHTSGIYAAAVHYWRLARDTWEPVLDAVAATGCTAVSIYVPWEAHELERGRFDFGEGDPSLDVDAFMTLAEDRGLDVVARPGPQINGEMDRFGFPARVLADERLHALGPSGAPYVLTQVPRPIPALSYAEDRFFDEVALWYDAVCPILARHQLPQGRLLACQVDNEMAYFFGVNAYSADYSPASVAGYQAFLERKAGSISTLNEQYGTGHGSFAEVDPPRRFEGTGRQDIPRLADWAEYRERSLVDSLARLAGMLRERGLDQVALFHNYPHPLNPGSSSSGFSTPFNLVALEEELDFVGFDIYSRKEVYEHVKTLASYVAGSSRFPYAPELIAGAWPWYQDPGDLADEEFVAKAALMNGLKGYSRYVLVERDRWLASPIRRDGSVRADKQDVFGRVNGLGTGLELHELRRRADVLLLADRDYDRLEAASVLVGFPGDFLETPTTFSEYPNALTVSEEPLGLAEPVQMVKREWFGDLFAGLTATGLAFLISDTELPGSRWAGYGAVVLQTHEYQRASVQEAAVAFAQAGGTVVVGPRLPTLDERMAPCTTLKDALESPSQLDGAPGTRYAVGAGAVVHVEDLTDAEATLAAALDGLSLLRPDAGDPALDVTVHAPAAGPPGRLVVFVANPTGETRDARILPGTPIASATDAWSGDALEVQDGHVVDRLEPYSIHVHACVPQGQEG